MTINNYHSFKAYNAPKCSKKFDAPHGKDSLYFQKNQTKKSARHLEKLFQGHSARYHQRHHVKSSDLLRGKPRP